MPTVPIRNYTLLDIREAIGDNSIPLKDIKGMLLHKSALIDGAKLDPRYCPGGSAANKLNNIKQNLSENGEFNMGYWRNYGNVFNTPVLLVVNDGTGGGQYLSGDIIDIAANLPEGYTFIRWDHISVDDSVIEDSSNPNTRIVIGNIDTEISAITLLNYLLTVVNGTGSGSYAPSSEINISANVPQDYRFTNWTGDTQYLDSIINAETIVTMPNGNISITANFELAYSLIKYGYLYNWYATQPKPTVKHGYLYNFHTVLDVRNIANTGWHVPTTSDYSTLRDYLGGLSVAGGKMKEVGLTYWTPNNIGATNISGFNGRGSGYRSNSGSYSSINTSSTFWSSDIFSSTFAYYYSLSGNNALFGSSSADYYYTGKSIRLIKDSTTLTNGQIGSYIGNDGYIYKTICIGTQEYLSENLVETKYRNGDSISIVTDNTTWIGLTTGASCSYNNDTNNAFSNTYIYKEGWHIPTNLEWYNLITYVGEEAIAGGKLKETGLVRWNSPNVGATNELNFNGIGGGYRDVGGFQNINTIGRYLSSSLISTNVLFMQLETISATANRSNMAINTGMNIRLIKDSTTLNNGETSTYVGNDGKIYRTICINGIEYTADNLAETKYRNGDLILTITDNAAWLALVTGGKCAYNNDESNV